MNLGDLPYVVEPMRMRDVPTVHTIEERVFSLPWSTTAFTQELMHNRASEYIVLRYLPWARGTVERDLGAPRSRRRSSAVRHRVDRSLLGYGGLWMMVEEAHISTLALQDAWRGRGLGELLLVSLIEVAMTRNADLVTLEVRTSNLTAQSLYSKYGFKKVGRRSRYYSDNGEDAHIMSTDCITAPEYQSAFEQRQSALRQRLIGQHSRRQNG